MIRWEKILAALVVGLVVTVTACADMLPVSAVGIEGPQSARTPGEVQAQPANSAGLFDYQSITNLTLETVRRSPGAGIDLDKSPQTQPPKVLTGGESNLSLCLSALVCLGLCSSSHYVKNLSFGFIPEWYHDGGPLQIGHSHAVNPDSLCSVLVCCFVQPAATPEDRLPQYRLGTIVSLWRKSQFTSDVLAARGPPVNHLSPPHTCTWC